MLRFTESGKEMFRKCMAFLRQAGKQSPERARELRASLAAKMKFLRDYANDPQEPRTICEIFGDFCPLSFNFTMYAKKEGKEVFWFNGGLVFHGAHDGGGDGGAPTFSVCLTPTDGWSIHT